MGCVGESKNLRGPAKATPPPMLPLPLAAATQLERLPHLLGKQNTGTFRLVAEVRGGILRTLRRLP